MAIPFRVVLVDDQHDATEVVGLLRAPDAGDAILLANGDVARVWRVITTDDPAVVGVILAEVEPQTGKLAADGPPI
jgi:hypothetical protein